MLGCHRHYLDTLTSRSDAHPIYLLKCDNTAGESWLNKSCKSSPTGRELARLQASLLLDHSAGFHFGRVDTNSNVIADGISRIPSEPLLSNDFPILLTQAPSLLCCQRFLPNAGFVLLIVDVLLRTAFWDPLTVAGSYGPIPEDSFPILVPRRRPTRPLYSGAPAAGPQLGHCVLHGLAHSRPHHHRSMHPVRHAPWLHQAGNVAAHRLRTAPPTRC